MTISRALKHLLISVLAILLCGCLHSTTAPSVEERQPSPPAGWSNTHAFSPTEPRNWLDSFDDPQLKQLIAECLLQNFSLRSALAQTAAAQARAAQSSADLYPDTELELSAGRRRSTPGPNHTTASNFGLNGSIQWQIDLWDRLDNLARAASLEAMATAADYRALQFSLAAAVAKSWYRLSEYEQQLQLAEQTEQSFARSVEIIEEQYRGGLSSALDLRLARTERDSARSLLALRQRQSDNEKRQLELILGRYPAGQIEGAKELPQLLPQPPVGLPAGLLERRPDLQAEKQRLQATDYRLTSAQRNYLPQLLLTTSAGTVSDKLYRLLDWDYLLWSLASSLTQSLFDGGAKQAERELARAQLEKQLADYADIALTAFSEVEQALDAEATLKKEEQALRLVVAESHDAYLLAEQRYRQGLEDVMTLLSTQRRAFSSRSNLLRLNRLRLENRIDLHLALGGPFSDTDRLNRVSESP